MAILIRDTSKSFTELKKVTGAADGNLSIHLRRLEEAEYVTVEKSFVNRRPQTVYTITDLGKKSFIEYINLLEKIIGESEK